MLAPCGWEDQGNNLSITTQSNFLKAMAVMTDNSKGAGVAIEAHYQFLAWPLPTLEKFPRSHKFNLLLRHRRSDLRDRYTGSSPLVFALMMILF